MDHFVRKTVPLDTALDHLTTVTGLLECVLHDVTLIGSE